MIAPPAALPVPAAALGEGPCWDDAAGALYWIDVPAGRVHRLNADDAHAAWEIGQPVGAVAPRAGGGLAVAARDGFLSLDVTTGQTAVLAAVEAGMPQNRMNDGACDRAGRFYAGTIAQDETPGAGTLYRLGTDHTVTPVLTGLTISNGIGWSPDERLMYYIDSPTHGVDVFDYDPVTGAIDSRRRFADVGQGDTVPDGLTVDADGFVWVAVWGGGAVLRHDLSGRVCQRVELPAARVTSCAFGGADLRRLYITTAAGPADAGGVLFACKPGATGLPACPYRG
ncbi:MAG: SMP-30/gluconolactonase/LRE family protein [Streptosporangiaceae bacterium]